jgi:hypothetical protein
MMLKLRPVLERRFARLDDLHRPAADRILMMLADKPGRMSGDNERMWYDFRHIYKECATSRDNTAWILLQMKSKGLVEHDTSEGRNRWRLTKTNWGHM